TARGGGGPEMRWRSVRVLAGGGGGAVLLVGLRGLRAPGRCGSEPGQPDARFAGLQWTFARIQYDAWTLPPGRRYDIFDEPWTIDYPAADWNLSRRGRTAASVQVDEPIAIRSEEPALWC